MNGDIKKKIKILEGQITLLTPSGKIHSPIQIACDSKTSVAPKFEISLTYEEVEYKGYGTDFLWTDAFADLEIKLPNDVKIACCMTCRHGNMCPYGDVENQLFCTKDLEINSKWDMCNLFNQTNPFEERLVSSLDFCEDFVYQSEEYYTYNDYQYELRKKKAKL